MFRKFHNGDNKKVSAGQGGIEVPSDVVDKDFWKLVVIYQFWYSISGLIVSVLAGVGGILLFVNGVSGSSDWSAEIFGIKMTGAAPGVVLCLVGLAVARFTRFDVSLSEKADPPASEENGRSSS